MDNVISSLYDKYISFYYSNNYYHLIHTNPTKFYKILKTKKNYSSFSKETQAKIFNHTCEMIKSINIDRMQLGLKLLEEIINHIPSHDLVNSFTYNNTLSENNYGIFAYVLEEKKEIKIQTLKLISDYSNIIKTEKNFAFIIELINDEEDEVRYATIDCLLLLINKIDSFPFTLCEILLFALREKQTKLRRKIFDLISLMKFSIDKVQFKKVITCFKENMAIFFQDKAYIFATVKQFTKLNCMCLTEAYFTDCFKLDNNFMITEYNWENECYILDIITFMEFIVWKKFKVNMFIPSFFVKHFYYYEEKYPTVFNEGLTAFFNKKKWTNQSNDAMMDIEDNCKETKVELNNNEDIEQYLLLKENKGHILIEDVYLCLFKFLELNTWKEETAIIIRRLIMNVKFKVIIENIEQKNKFIEINDQIVQLLHKDFYDRLRQNSVIIKENIYLLLTEEIKLKELIIVNLISPENYQTYPHRNQRKGLLPFVLSLHIKISNITFHTSSTWTNQSIKIFLMKKLKIIISNNQNAFEKEISLLPSSEATISIYQTYIIIKKKETLFLKNNKPNQVIVSTSDNSKMMIDNNVKDNVLNNQFSIKCGLMDSNNNFNCLIQDTIFNIQSDS